MSHKSKINPFGKCITCRTRHSELHSNTCWQCRRRTDRAILRLRHPVEKAVADVLRDKGIRIIGDVRGVDNGP